MRDRTSALAAIGRTDQHGRAHRMTKSENRWRAIRQNDFTHKSFEVGVEIGEAAHVAFVPIAQRAIRQSLAAPVEDGDSEPPCAEVAHGLEIFFDPLRTTRKNANRAPPARGRRKPRISAAPTPSGVLSMPVTALSGTGLAGMEMSFISACLPASSALLRRSRRLPISSLHRPETAAHHHRSGPHGRIPACRFKRRICHANLRSHTALSFHRRV